MNKDQISDQLFDARQVLQTILQNDELTPYQCDLVLKAIQALWDIDTSLMDD